MNEKRENITPLSLYLNRRQFLKASISAATALGTVGVYRHYRKNETQKAESPQPANKTQADGTTEYKTITHYNNFYEFSTDKEAVADAAKNWAFNDWDLTVDGLVESPIKLNLKDLANAPTEERIYRFRCVEGWSMVIPWLGSPLARWIDRARPLSTATHVAFETYFNEKDMPEARSAGIAFPYTEGLRLDEAMHPLTLLATGLYGKNLPNQNGAPIRLVVPWKYGFKSIKSITRITLTDHEPPTTWNIANPREYGFYSNVNPDVDHPRWSQKHERRIGEFGLRPTLPFNGYGDQVASLYSGMDLRKYF
jgi:sulfoxide reductase catalytic subunit YedY